MVSALFRSASTASFDRLYRQHAASVYRYARAVLGSHVDAEDVTQQTFLNAYRAIAQGTKPRKAENWLFTIAHNEVRRHLRDTRAQRLEVELDGDVADQAPERSEPSVADVLRALQHLTPNQRSALVMREFEGRSYAEIAEIMDVSQGALETLVFRARRSLADALEDGLTCAEAELAVSRRVDGRLSRREARRLKAHMRECRICRGFEVRQRRQRSLLKGLSVIPVPASLLVFRGEVATAAGTATAVGAVGAGGAAGIAAKAAAVAAVVTVAGGVGYSAGTHRLTAREPKARVAQQQPASYTAGTAAPGNDRPTRAPQRAVVPPRAPSKAKREERRALRPERQRPELTKTSRAEARKARRAAKVSENGQPEERAARSLKAKLMRAGPPSKRVKPEKKPKPVKPSELPAAQRRAERPQRAAVPLPVPALPPGQVKQLLDPRPAKP